MVVAALPELVISSGGESGVEEVRWEGGGRREEEEGGGEGEREGGEGGGGFWGGAVGRELSGHRRRWWSWPARPTAGSGRSVLAPGGQVGGERVGGEGGRERGGSSRGPAWTHRHGLVGGTADDVQRPRAGGEPSSRRVGGPRLVGQARSRTTKLGALVREKAVECVVEYYGYQLWLDQDSGSVLRDDWRSVSEALGRSCRSGIKAVRYDPGRRRRALPPQLWLATITLCRPPTRRRP